VDTETTGLEFHDTPFCTTLTWEDKQGCLEHAYVSLEGKGGESRKRLLSSLLTSVPTWIFHNAKFDLQKLALINVITQEQLQNQNVEDTAIIFQLLNENEPKGLKHLARTILNEETNEEEVLAKVRRKLKLKKTDGYALIPREYIIPYALKDTEFTYRIWQKAKPRLVEIDDGLLNKYAAELAVMRAVLRIEANGMGLDLPFLNAEASKYGVLVMEGWNSIVSMTGNAEFNPQSPQQLLTVFAERGITLESTGEAALSALINKTNDPLAQAILEYRSNKKVHTTYLTALQSEHKEGIMYPNFNMIGPRTGRASSSKVVA